MLTLDMIKDAQKALNGIARRTPLDPAPKLGANVYIKAENLQLTGAFKLRGAYNKIRSLTPEEAARGVIACSAGNHAQGVALSSTKLGVKSIICMPAGAPISKVEATKGYGAEVVLVPGVYDDAARDVIACSAGNHAQGVALSSTKLGVKSIICMPAGAPISKVEATKGYGAEVVLVPGVYDDAAREAERLAKEQGYTFAHPFDDPYVIAGQGTIGLEILEQLPDATQVVVPIGGGGLISGIAMAIKMLNPSCKVIGVQAAGAASMYTSVQQGQRVELSHVSTIADGIAVKKPGELTFELCQKYVDEVVTVNDGEIASAILFLLETQKTVAEGAGATPVAAVMSGKVDTTKGKTVCVVSGGNVDVTTLSRVITKGLSNSGRIVEISTKIADKPGSLIQLLQVVSSTGANVVHIHHTREDRHSEVGECIVSMVLETIDQAHIHQIENALKASGYHLEKR